MEIQTAFINEWNQKTILWAFNIANTDNKIPVNIGTVKHIYFKSTHNFFKQVCMCVSYMHSRFNPSDSPFQTITQISQDVCEQIMFSDLCGAMREYVYDTNKFFKNKRNFYMECRTNWLLLCVFHEICDGLRCARLSNVEMVFRDSYMMKMIVLY